MLHHNTVNLTSIDCIELQFIELNWNCNLWQRVRFPVRFDLNGKTIWQSAHCFFVIDLAAATLQTPPDLPQWVLHTSVSVPGGQCILAISFSFWVSIETGVFLKDKIGSPTTHTVDSLEFNGSEMPPLTAVCCVEGFGNDGPPIHQGSVARPSANEKAEWFVSTNEIRRNPCSSYTSVVSGCFIRAHILNPQ